MTFGALLIISSVVVLWVVALSSWKLRNWRASVFLTGASLAMLAAGTLPGSIAPLLQGTLWTVAVLLLLERNRYLCVVSPSELSFIEGYTAVLRRLVRLKSAAGPGEPAVYMSEFEGLIQDLEDLAVPDDEWSRIRTDTARELRRRLVIMRLGTRPRVQTMDHANAEWARIERRFADLRRSRTGFWVRWPRWY